MMLLRTLHQEFRINIGGIDDMFTWSELTFRKCILNERLHCESCTVPGVVWT